jgi:hypothetical protein
VAGLPGPGLLRLNGVHHPGRVPYLQRESGEVLSLLDATGPAGTVQDSGWTVQLTDGRRFLLRRCLTEVPSAPPDAFGLGPEELVFVQDAQRYQVRPPEP